MRALDNYFIVGWCCKSRYFSVKTYKKIKKGELDASKLTMPLVLILMDGRENIRFKHFGYYSNGVVKHAINENSTYFKFARAVFGIRRCDKALWIDFEPNNFLGHYVSYDPIAENWIKTPKSCEFKVGDIEYESLFRMLNTSYFKHIHIIDYRTL